MNVLYNTTVHAAMNDISVTTGNADGWVLVLRDPMTEPLPAPLTRRAESTKRKNKRPAKRKS